MIVDTILRAKAANSMKSPGFSGALPPAIGVMTYDHILWNRSMAKNKIPKCTSSKSNLMKWL